MSNASVKVEIQFTSEMKAPRANKIVFRNARTKDFIKIFPSFAPKVVVVVIIVVVVVVVVVVFVVITMNPGSLFARLFGQSCLKRMKKIGAKPRPSLHGPTVKNVSQLVLDNNDNDDDDADDDDDES